LPGEAARLVSGSSAGRGPAELGQHNCGDSLLADVEEFTYEEIARVTECPIGTVMSRLNRGRKMLARLIRTYGEAKGTGPKPDEFVRRKL
jgi:hypothetical protein